MEFDRFTVQTKINENLKKIDIYNRTLLKIQKNADEIEVKSIQRVNKVALFNVMLMHTNEYTIKLGGDYYAKVKDKTALEIIKQRITSKEEENVKWAQFKNKIIQIQAAKNKHKKPQQAMEVIGQNEDGQDIFNIVQFGQDPMRGSTQIGPIRTPQNQLTIIKQKDQQQNEDDTQQKESENQVKKDIQAKQKNRKQIERKKIEEASKAVEEAPKKISKFKADRMQMKNS